MAVYGGLLDALVELGGPLVVTDAGRAKEISSRKVSKATATKLSRIQPGGLAKLYQDTTSEDEEEADEATWLAVCKNEIDSYKKATKIPWNDYQELIEANPLLWWTLNKHNFPNLWRLAKIYPAIPATSASSERAFSVAGNIITLQRCRLAATTVEDLHFIHENTCGFFRS